ncbi:hypothetical protein PENTCL1PPCAC_10182, partial [Pristionchus entomophagus]
SMTLEVEPSSGTSVTQNSDSFAAADTSPDETEEPSCGICFEPLSIMRSVKMDPCSHRFHRSCSLRWFEANDRVSVFYSICRSKVSQNMGEDGKAIPGTYPFEEKAVSCSEAR